MVSLLMRQSCGRAPSAFSADTKWHGSYLALPSARSPSVWACPPSACIHRANRNAPHVRGLHVRVYVCNGFSPQQSATFGLTLRSAIASYTMSPSTHGILFWITASYFFLSAALNVSVFSSFLCAIASALSACGAVCYRAFACTHRLGDRRCWLLTAALRLLCALVHPVNNLQVQSFWMHGHIFVQLVPICCLRIHNSLANQRHIEQ